MTGIFFGKPVWETLYWQKFGIPAQGEIVEIRDSSTQVNGRPQKEMTVLFMGTERIHRSVSPSFILNINSQSVSIRHNPKDTTVFALDYKPSSHDVNFGLFWVLLGSALFFTGMYLFFRYKKTITKYNYIQQYGQAVEGKILALQNGTIKVNHVWYVRVELSFLGQTQTIENIPPSDIKGLKVNGPIDLKYNSQNPNEFVLARS